MPLNSWIANWGMLYIHACGQSVEQVKVPWHTSVALPSQCAVIPSLTITVTLLKGEQCSSWSRRACKKQGEKQDLILTALIWLKLARVLLSYHSDGFDCFCLRVVSHLCTTFCALHRLCCYWFWCQLHFVCHQFVKLVKRSLPKRGLKGQ